jgi:Ca-activated chloride channel family protein
MATSETPASVRHPVNILLAAFVGACCLGMVLVAQDHDTARFTSGIELVNVTATVTDEDGRFVDSLRKEDFSVFENGTLQELSHFSAGKVPVSLGIALDASGSMTQEKMAAARSAIDRFLFELLDHEDEIFFMKFSSESRVLQAWTTDRSAISRAVERVEPSGGTAIYDAVARALPMAEAGRHRKKAILVISDGNDTSSSTSIGLLRNRIRESEVLVYALGVDSVARTTRPAPSRPPTFPVPRPFPWPGNRRGPQRIPPVIIGGGPRLPAPGERVNGDALRLLTDDTGGRTEIVRGFNGLEGATARLASELSKQYYLGYSSTEPKDGRWHSIRVDVRDKKLHVRARRGYVASEGEGATRTPEIRPDGL